MHNSSGEEWVEGLAGTDLTYLRGVAFSHRPYRQYTRSWDHDHCASCTAGFSEDEPGDLREGWTTTADYEPGAEYDWLCETCFSRLQRPLRLRVVEDPRPARPLGVAPAIGTPYEKPHRVHS